MQRLAPLSDGIRSVTALSRFASVLFATFGALAGILAAVGLGLVLGLPTLRQRAEYLAITTIAAAEVLRLVVRSSWATDVTGGVFGLQGFADEFFALNPFASAATYDLGPISVTGRRLWVMLVGWTLVVVLTLVMRKVIRSPWGRLLRSIREDEDTARSVGKNVFARKLQALTVGGALGALAGALLAIEQQNVNPDSFRPEITFILYVVVILGGAGTIWGPVIGAVVFQFLYFFFDGFMRQAEAEGWFGDLIDATGAQQVKLVLVGVGLMALMILRPQGILGHRLEQLAGE